MQFLSEKGGKNKRSGKKEDDLAELRFLGKVKKKGRIEKKTKRKQR